MSDTPKFQEVEEALLDLHDPEHNHEDRPGPDPACCMCIGINAVRLAVAREVAHAVQVAEYRAGQQGRSEGIAQGRREMAREALAHAAFPITNIEALREWLESQAREGEKVEA